jgi:hypothetical protein
MIATPYAGITRVRFKGYNLSRSFHGLNGTPRVKINTLTVKKQFF